MKSIKQIFKKIPDYDYITKVFLTTCDIIKNNDKHQIFFINDELFKKYLFFDNELKIFDLLKDCYYISKIKYLSNRFTYKGFITILRHLSNCTTNISYTKTTKYRFNTYYIEYKFILEKI